MEPVVAVAAGKRPKVISGSFPPVPETLVARDPAVVEAWAGYVEMRKKKKLPLTVRAANLVFSKLEKSASMPSAILDMSIERGWTGVYPDACETPSTELVAPTMDALVYEVWMAFPEKSRGRSSPVEFVSAWERLGPALPSKEVLIAAINSWITSEKWASEGGRWTDSAHKWLANRQWLNPQRSPMEIAEENARRASEYFR